MSRHICSNCKRPNKLCYCGSLPQINNQVKILIIQHPLEEKHPFNTGRMANLCLQNSELIITETLTQKQLNKIQTTPSALLYPSLTWLNEAKSISVNNNLIQDISQLVVIDASWRKSKKMLHLNPELQFLTRLSLAGDLKSNYQIRNSNLKNALSTIESITQALTFIEPTLGANKLLIPFEKMISLQQSVANIKTSNHQ